MSLHELTACIYYKIAVERGLRGCNPDGELIAHKLHLPNPPLHPPPPPPLLPRNSSVHVHASDKRGDACIPGSESIHRTPESSNNNTSANINDDNKKEKEEEDEVEEMHSNPRHQHSTTTEGETVYDENYECKDIREQDLTEAIRYVDFD